MSEAKKCDWCGKLYERREDMPTVRIVERGTAFVSVKVYPARFTSGSSDDVCSECQREIVTAALAQVEKVG